MRYASLRVRGRRGVGRLRRGVHPRRVDAPARAPAGVTRVLEGGDVFEKAAANVSIIRGVLTPERAAAMSARGRPGVDPAGGQPHAAAALSLVFHPRAPMVPTFRADVRRFTVDGTSWFGGGADLTPYYLRDEDAVAFHAHWRAVCNAHDAAVVESEAETEDRSWALHARCKRWCDEYFYIPARKEHRGVGGIFFDDMSDDENETGVADVARASDPEAFTRAVALGWTSSYAPIVKRRVEEPFGEAHERWHQQTFRAVRRVQPSLRPGRAVRPRRRARGEHHGLRAAEGARGLRRRAGGGERGGEARGRAQEADGVVTDERARRGG